jgi:hypothetical protein
MWPNLHKVLSAFQRLLERVKSTSENENKNLKNIRGVLTTSFNVHTKFERIWLKTVVLRGLQKQRFCIRSSRASKDFRLILYARNQILGIETTDVSLSVTLNHRLQNFGT